MARCYQALGQMDLAVTTYQRFIAQPGIDQATKQQAEQKVKEIEAAVKETGGKGRGGATAAGTAAGAQKEPVSFSPWQYILLGVGGAAIIGGGVTMGIGFAKASDAEDQKNQGIPADEYDELISDADTMKAIGYALLGMGGCPGHRGSGAVDHRGHGRRER